MSNRRVPLSNNPNAVNSPFRTVTVSAVVSKQKRSYANVQREEAYGQAPPAKKQMLESHQLLRTPCKQLIQPQSTNIGSHTSREKCTQEVSIDRRMPAVRDGIQYRTAEELKSIRQWQKHYQRIFPSFVFYFENITPELHTRYSAAVMSLGARKEMFFSNTVTHVVTTRTIPPPANAGSAEMNDIPSSADSNAQSNQPSTINPLLLDRSSESTSFQLEPGTITRNTIDASFLKKTGMISNPGQFRRTHERNPDVLYKARELGMKIWSLEKLDRIVSVIFDIDTGPQVRYKTSARLQTTSTATSRCRKGTDLQHLLRNERINGPSDRDMSVFSKDLCLFRGPFICVHDIEGKKKPILIREYPKVHHKEDGEWPQFRNVMHGKCPFIDEVEYSKREAEKEIEDFRLRKQIEKEKAYNTRRFVHSTSMQPQILVTNKKIHGETRGTNGLSNLSTNEINFSAHPNKLLTSGVEKASAMENAFVSRAGVGRLYGGEPIASGVQPNLTSAIRSTMSSTAPRPGVKAGISKEVHDLQRKVFEKMTKDVDVLPIIPPRQIINVTSTQTKDQTTQIDRISRENMSLIKVDIKKSDADGHGQMPKTASKATVSKTISVVHQEPKPGYCENCLDKFEDFEEHIKSRKHRKFAEKLENWKMLDDLLHKLARPPRKDFQGYS